MPIPGTYPRRPFTLSEFVTCIQHPLSESLLRCRDQAAPVPLSLYRSMPAGRLGDARGVPPTERHGKLTWEASDISMRYRHHPAESSRKDQTDHLIIVGMAGRSRGQLMVPFGTNMGRCTKAYGTAAAVGDRCRRHGGSGDCLFPGSSAKPSPPRGVRRRSRVLAGCGRSLRRLDSRRFCGSVARYRGSDGCDHRG
jgi:hypothetical protein